MRKWGPFWVAVRTCSGIFRFRVSKHHRPLSGSPYDKDSSILGVHIHPDIQTITFLIGCESSRVQG